jgi:dihydroorotate dehydrogenase electron transfer subunit
MRCMTNIDNYIMKAIKVLSNVKLAKDTYMLEGMFLSNIHEKPNPFSFFMVWIPRVDEIPLSIADFDEGKIRFLYKIKGEGTKALSDHKESIIGVRGPFGKGIKIKPAIGSRWLIIAGGIGIAPIPYLVKTWKTYEAQFDILWGVKTVEEIFDIKTFFPYMERSRIIITTEDCHYKNGYCGLITDVLKHMNVKDYDGIIAVGPNSMLKTICLDLYEMNPYISLETIVKCGIGICGSCYIKSSDKLLCIDGPIFRCSEVIEYLRTNSLNS